MHPLVHLVVTLMARHHHTLLRPAQHLATHATQGAVTPKEGGYIAAALFLLVLYGIVRFATRNSRRERRLAQRYGMQGRG